jgi:DNA-binding PadR family transcriptional regulator
MNSQSKAHESRKITILRLLDKRPMNHNQVQTELVKEGIPGSRSYVSQDLRELELAGLIHKQKVVWRGKVEQSLYTITREGKEKFETLPLTRISRKYRQTISQTAARKVRIYLDWNPWGYSETTHLDATIRLWLNAEPILRASETLESIGYLVDLQGISESIVNSVVGASYDARAGKHPPKDVDYHFKVEKSALNFRGELRIGFNGRSAMNKFNPKAMARRAEIMNAKRQQAIQLIRGATTSDQGRREVLQATLHELLRVRGGGSVRILHRLALQFWTFAHLSHPPSPEEIKEIMNEWEREGFIEVTSYILTTEKLAKKIIQLEPGMNELFSIAITESYLAYMKRHKPAGIPSLD